LSRLPHAVECAQILKKCPNHGETLAMKGINLFFLYPDRRSEAHELAKAALKADMQSHMCWHVYGILHKSDRDYHQAAKCYLNALKWDPENTNLFRDLSNIQMQIRDIKGLVDTATKMLSIRSSTRGNWMLLAVAHHLDKNYETANSVRHPCCHGFCLPFFVPLRLQSVR
jgi:N-alpha-acetyltransferase 15/16, NatA auxiliary subunit